MESLFGFMNFLPVMGKDSFSEMNKDIAVSYSKVATGCMLEAANEVHSGADDNLLCDIAVSCDGTWQKRGFSSLLGAVTMMVHGRREDFLLFWELSRDNSRYW